MADLEAPLRVALLGLGRMGRNHLRVLSLLKDVALEYIYDADRDLSGRLAAESGSKAAGDLDEALAGVDAVVICTPTSTHAEYIRQASKAVRHIFVEKPLTDTLETTDEAARLAADLRLHIQVGFIERFNPAVEQMKRLLDQSSGVVSVDFVRTNKISARITDVDVITDLMIHDIDLALHLNGPVKSVSAHGAMSDGMIGFASALLSHENGRFSRIQASRITDKKMRSIQATCKDMFVDCELLRKEIRLSRETEMEQHPGEPYKIIGVQEAIEVPPHEALVAELQSFVAACRGIPSPVAAEIDEAVEAMRICEQIRASILV